MSLVRRLRHLYIRHFGQPAHERPIYRDVHRRRVTRLLEIGLGTGARAQRLIELAAAASPATRIDYAAIDLFEMRRPHDGSGLSLKLAHRQLSQTEARVQLLPGDAFSALVRSANSLVGRELIIISLGQDVASLERAWFYVPRLVAAGGRVLIEEQGTAGQPTFREVSAAEIARLAAAASPRRAA